MGICSFEESWRRVWLDPRSDGSRGAGEPASFQFKSVLFVAKNLGRVGESNGSNQIIFRFNDVLYLLHVKDHMKSFSETATAHLLGS
jgi:hypothetical protein